MPAYAGMTTKGAFAGMTTFPWISRPQVHAAAGRSTKNEKPPLGGFVIQTLDSRFRGNDIMVECPLSRT
jgi:hypothetical protein